MQRLEVSGAVRLGVKRLITKIILRMQGQQNIKKLLGVVVFGGLLHYHSLSSQRYEC